MAHSAIHFSVGMIVGTIITLKPLICAWRCGGRLAGRLAKALTTSYALGLYAILPSLLRHFGLSERYAGAWWMNAFLLHPLLSKLKAGGTVLGPVVLSLCFAAQYLCLLAIVRRFEKARRPQSG